jgi:hypothetical protein
MLPDARSVRGHVLVTTREASWSWQGACRVDLGVWSTEEAVHFLATRLGYARPMTQSTAVHLEALAGVLGCVPLALEQSAAYLNMNEVLREAGLAGYVARLRADIGAIEMHAESRYLEGGYRATLVATFRDCVALVRAMEGGERALDLLRAVSFMDGARGIPQRGLLDAIVADVGDAVLCLRRVSLVRETEEKEVLVHSLVQQLTWRVLLEEPGGARRSEQRGLLGRVADLLRFVGIDKRSAVDDREVWRRRAGEAIVRALPKGDDVYKQREWSRRVVVHGAKCAGLYPQQEDAPLDPDGVTWQSDLLWWTATCLHRLALYDAEEGLWRRRLYICERALGRAHPQTAATLHELARLHQAQGRYGEAEPLYARALAIKEAALGRDHPQTAATLSNLAGLHQAQGKYAAAEPLYARALAIEEATLGRDHPETAATLMGLASLHRARSNDAEAEPMFRRALEILERVLGPDHPDARKARGWLDLCRRELEQRVVAR